jgi:hypothetical protein
VAELQPSGTPNYSAHSPFDQFWEEVDRNRCFTWVLRLDAIGDLLLTVSYLYAFKRQNPKRRIGLIVRKEFVKWLRRLDWIDKICGVDAVYWENMLAGIPQSEGQPTAWMNLMPGMLRVAGNRILSGRDGLKASAYPDGSTHCEFSPGRSVTGMRELFGLVFNRVKPELPIPYPRTGTDNSIWFSPFPGADERLWPPDAWARALSPLAGKRIILQPSSKPVHRRWHSEFIKHAVAQGLKVESAGPTASIFELVQRMASSKAWVGINSAPMHAAALLGLPAVALGLPWEINTRWRHPELQIVAAEGLAIQIQQSPTPKNLHEFVLTNCRQDDWADGLYLDPELFASALRQHPMMKLL